MAVEGTLTRPRVRPEEWRAEYGDWPPFSFSEFLDEAPERFPEMIVTDDRCTLAFGDLVQRARRFAGGLAAMGVRQDDKVALWMENRVEWLEAWFAIAWLGAVIVPVNTRLSHDEISYVVEHSDTSWAIVSPGAGPAGDALDYFDGIRRRGRLEGLIVSDQAAGDANFESLLESAPAACGERPGQVGMILFTSGSTAFPKGVMLLNGCLVWNGFAIGRSWMITTEDRPLVANPLFHNGGAVFNLMASVTHGGRPRLMSKWDLARGADVIAEEGITVFTGVDTLLRDLLVLKAREHRSWPSLRVISVASDQGLIGRIHSELGAEPSGVYGLTECTTNVALGDLRDPREKREQYVGRPQVGLDVRIADAETNAPVPAGEPGEIQVRGWTVMEGYYGDAQANASAFTEDGFVHTGDLGTMSEDGYLNFRGRLKLMIKSGGENVSLEEVESVLRKHPAVSDAIVVPAPDPRFTEVGWALIVLEDEQASADEIEAFARRSLANFKVPKRFILVSDLPRTGSGKVDRTRLRREHVEGVNA